MYVLRYHAFLRYVHIPVQRSQKFEKKFWILNRALSRAITSFGNKFCLKGGQD